MGPFIARDIIKPVMDFIKTCPFFEQYNIDISPMTVGRIVTARPNGSALDYVGSVLVSDDKDLIKKRFTARQANFQLWLPRKTGHDVYREEIANFLFNFEQWIEYCQAYGLAPKLSEHPNGKIVETMFADNGVYFAEWEGEESSLYMIQIHILYYNEYEEVF